MLTQMNAMKLISFDYDAKEWGWDLQKIAAMNVPEDIVGFLLDELDKRHPPSFGRLVLIRQFQMKRKMCFGSQLVSVTRTSVSSFCRGL